MIPSLITENISNNMEEWIRPENPILDLRGQNRNKVRHRGGDDFLSGAEQEALLQDLTPYVHFCKKGIKTLKSLLSQSVKILLLHERFWLSFENRFRLCFEDYQTLPMKKFICKWWVKITSVICITNRLQPAVEMVKGYMLRIKRHFFQFEAPPIRITDYRKEATHRQILDGIPRFPTGTWMAKEPVELTREERSLLSSFITTRSLPHADGEKVEDSLRKHSAVLHETHGKLTDIHIEWLRATARVACLELRLCYDTNLSSQGSHAHISITNSATYESTRTQGGRATYVRKRFWEYVRGRPELGEPYFEDKFEDPDFDLEEDGPDYRDRGHRFGGIPYRGYVSDLDPRFFKYMSFSALTECENSRYFELLVLEAFRDQLGNGFIRNFRGDPVRTNLPYPMKRSAVCEPGGKARIVTQTPASLTTIGQPIQHVLKEVLAADPTLRAGLGAAAQSFEVHKRLNKTNPHPEGDLFFGDFEEATDYIRWDIFKIIFEEFAEIFGIEPDTWLYFYLHELLPSPCLMEDDKSAGPTVRGLLMGLPGTKFALHLINKVLNVFVRGRTEPRTYAELLMDPFGAAGDDIFDIDKIRVVRFPLSAGLSGPFEERWFVAPLNVGARYLIGATLLGMKMSDSKSGVFRGGGPYCEVPILDKDFSKPAWDGLGGFQDALRLRLISPETKQSKGDEDTSPLVGKAFQFAKELAWQPDIFPNRKTRAVYSFFVDFRKYISRYDYHLELHPFLGGLGLQIHTDEELFALIPDWYKRLISAYLDVDHPDMSRRAVKVFHRWNSDRLSRGVGIEYDSEIEEALTPYISYGNIGDAYWSVVKACADIRTAHKQGKEEAELREIAISRLGDDLTPIGRFLPPCPEKDARYVDKVKFLRQFGIIPLRDLVRDLSGHDMWDEETKPSRGFQSLTVREKTQSQLDYMGSLFDHYPVVDFQSFSKLVRSLKNKDEFVNTVFIHTHSTSKMEVADPPEKLKRYCHWKLSVEEVDGALPQVESYYLDLRSVRTVRIEMNVSNQEFLTSKRINFLSSVYDVEEDWSE